MDKSTFLDIVKKTAPNVVIKNEADTDLPLGEIGLDSLDSMSVILALQEASGVTIPDDSIDGLKTLNQVFNYFKSERI